MCALLASENEKVPLVCDQNKIPKCPPFLFCFVLFGEYQQQNRMFTSRKHSKERQHRCLSKCTLTPKAGKTPWRSVRTGFSSEARTREHHRKEKKINLAHSTYTPSLTNLLTSCVLRLPAVRIHTISTSNARNRTVESNRTQCIVGAN